MTAHALTDHVRIFAFKAQYVFQASMRSSIAFLAYAGLRASPM
jgi:hypothetical protein